MKNARRVWLIRLGLLIALAVLGWELWLWGTSGKLIHVDDFVEYWAAARLFLSGDNPYDTAALFETQRAVGWAKTQPLIMWNPPWILTLIAPFGLLSYSLGRVLWFFLQIALVLLGSGLLWRIYAPEAPTTWPGWVLGICFAPTLFAIRVGQLAPFFFLGWVAFLWWERQRRDLWAGASLALITLKPHLLYLFWLFLALWVWQNRRWRIWGGLGLGLGFMIGLPALYSPAIIGQYLSLIAHSSPLYWGTPTWGALLRLILGVDKAWLQFVPPALGLLLGLYLAHRWGKGWRWEDAGPLVLLLSVITTAFGWSFDQVILLPAIIRSAIIARRSPLRWRIWRIAFILIEIAALGLNLKQADEIWYVWLAPAWLLLYLVSFPSPRHAFGFPSIRASD